MIKSLLGAALVLGMTTPAFAGPAFEAVRTRSVLYTFATPSGSPYCNGISLNEKGYMAVGFGIYTNCGRQDTNAGGFGGRIMKLSRDMLWIITTTDTGFAGTTQVYVIDEIAMQWQLYSQSDTNGDSPFQLINAGELLQGYGSKGRGNMSTMQGRS